jgi:hypothetical protein
MQDDAPPGTDAAPATTTVNVPAQAPPAQAAATYPGYGAGQYNQYAAYQQYYQQYQQAVCGTGHADEARARAGWQPMN